MMDITFRPASFPQDTGTVIELLTGYIRYLHEETAPAVRTGVMQKYPLDTVPEQVAHYAQLHAPPSGTILLAHRRDTAVGMGMMRERAPGIAEIQRVFVAAGARRIGLGRRLTLALMDAARSAGHRLVQLDTGRAVEPAVALYRDLGFREVPPYHDDTPYLADQLIYFEKDL